MDKITHERDKDGKIIIQAEGELYDYEAILSLKKNTNGTVYLPKDAINTFGIDNSILVKGTILDTVQREKGKNGEEPLVVDTY